MATCDSTSGIILPAGPTVDNRARCFYRFGAIGCSRQTSSHHTVIAAMPHAEDGRPVVAGSANCLIVDDEPSVRRSLSRMLQAQGCHCLEAGSGREGLRIL